MHSTNTVDSSRTSQNSEELCKTSKESWEQVAVPSEEARRAETPGGDENSEAKFLRAADEFEKADDNPKFHGDAEGDLEEPTRDLELLTVGSGRIKLRRGITMDSGAAHNVMPRKMVRDKGQIRPSEGSKRGAHYVAANNGRIPNEGEYDFAFSTSEGAPETMTFQIAEVNKALGSIS